MSVAERNQQEWEQGDNWRLGLYFGRHDTRFMVPKRRDPRDMTPNLGHPRAAYAVAGLVGIPILLMVFSFLFQLLR